jgi:hypothetical protein
MASVAALSKAMVRRDLLTIFLGVLLSLCGPRALCTDPKSTRLVKLDEPFTNYSLSASVEMRD